MGWTTPKTWASLTELLASDLNTHLRDNLSYLKAITDSIPFSGAQGTRGEAQNIQDDSYENITLTIQNYDYGGWFAPSSSKIIVPTGAIPGGYTTIACLCYGTVEYEASNGVGRRVIRLKKNGTAFGYQAIAGITDAQAIMVTDFATAVAGDEFQLETLQSSGGTIEATYTAFTVVRFAVVE